jgi:hypothetical protein
MPRTRSAKPATIEPTQLAGSNLPTARFQLESRSDNPSKLFILPSNITKSSRIVTLANPRHSKPSRYLVCPDTGIYEFIKSSVPKVTPRSWLVQSEFERTEQTPGYSQVTTTADLFVATRVDPVVLVLPALAASRDSRKTENGPDLFLSSYDYFQKLPAEASHLYEISSWEMTRTLFESRMEAVCETVEAEGEKMFRLSHEKLLAVIMEKAQSMAASGLPTSLDDKFVKKALEAPVLFKPQDESQSNKQSASSSADSDISTPKTASDESQLSTGTDSATVSTAVTSVAEESDFVSAMETSDEVFRLQRLRVAFDFICSRYIAPRLATKLQESLMKSELSNINFSPLDDYLTKIAQLRTEMLASRSVADYSRKRNRDEEEDEARAEKKRKAEEDKKKKATESRGLRELKKVNTTGMKKMSDFFKKK